jgi:hypothetical protein
MNIEAGWCLVLIIDDDTMGTECLFAAAEIPLLTHAPPGNC